MHAQQRSQELDSKILSAVFGAIDNVNQLLPVEIRLAKSPDTPILGPIAVLDSMSFVNLVAAVEERLTSELGVTLSLVGREDGRGSFKTVGTLVTYISQLLDAKVDQSLE